MSKETLRSNLHSAQSLAAGTEACQGIAKLDINKLTADQLKQVLQVAMQKRAMAKAKSCPAPALKSVKVEPKSPVKVSAAAPAAAPSQGGEMQSQSLAEADTVPADTQELLDMLNSTPATPVTSPSETALPSAATSPTNKAEQDNELLMTALKKIEELQAQIAKDPKTPRGGPDVKGATKKGDTDKAAPDDEDDGPGDEGENEDHDPPIVHPDGTKVLGADALRMRLRRLCETKASGRQWVDQQTKDDYKSGGERRQWLELALLESLKKHGTNRTNYQKVKAEFLTRVVRVRERMSSKEQEVTGKWLTEEKMKADYAPLTVKAITAYCRKFPQALVRAWKYNNEVEEFFIEDETVVKVKRADIYRERHTTEMDDIRSENAPKGPDALDAMGDEDTPTPEALGEQVMPDLEKFMETMNTKMSSAYDMVEVLEDPSNPPPMERYNVMADDLKRIIGKMEASFKTLAGYMTDMKMQELDKKPQESKLMEFRGKIEKVKEDIKPACADLLTIDINYKRLKRDITKAKAKANNGKVPEAETTPAQRGRKRKNKGKTRDSQEPPTKKSKKKNSETKTVDKTPKQCVRKSHKKKSQK